MQTLGRYELVRPLARGGMAEVYLARRRVAGVEKRLVIKRMRREHSRDPRFLDLFVREAQLSMALVQPNIVPVFDFGRIGDDVFLAMEHIDGKDLGSSLARDRSAGMRPLLAAFVAGECCQALDHAHQRRDAATPAGVIHRDVTPRNVLITWSGDVLLTDFGIAAVVGQAKGDTMGTPAYMAPEQARGGTVDPRADVYALGIVLWEAVVGVHVRPTENRAETVAAAQSGELPDVHASVPTALADVIRKATAADPDQRYASAHAMADALDAFVVAERARTGGPAPGRQLGEWMKARWAGAEEEKDDAAPASDAGGAVVTFLDDGAEALLEGTRTQRSMAETQASASTPVKQLPAGGLVADVPPAPETKTGRWIAAVLAVAIAAGAVVYATSDEDSPATVATVEPQPQPQPEQQPDPVPVPVPVPPPDPDTLRRAPPSALLAQGERGKDRKPKVDTPVVAVAKRDMTLGAQPWAYVTVDNDPTKHETPVTLSLTVGPHRVTFSNPQLGVTRTVTVTVPADGPARYVEPM